MEEPTGRKLDDETTGKATVDAEGKGKGNGFEIDDEERYADGETNAAVATADERGATGNGGGGVADRIPSETAAPEKPGKLDAG